MKIEAKAVVFTEALHKAMREEIGADNLDFTEDFTAMLLSIQYLFKVLVQNDTEDLIDITHILNKLAVQYLSSKEDE